MKENAFYLNYREKIKTIMTNIGNKSVKGATIGIIIPMLVYLLSIAKYIETGISPIFDIVVTSLILIIAFGVSFYIIKTAFTIAKEFNPVFVGVFLSFFIIANYLPDSFFIRPFIIWGLISGAVIGLAISKGLKKYVSAILIIVAVLANGYLFYYLWNDGFNKTAPVTDRYWNQKALINEIEDPSLEGTYKVKTLFYGNGNDLRRTEYNNEVEIKTSTVDATPFFDQTSGFDNYLRRIYWGFDSKAYPINARVWYPDGDGKYPLVIIVHGNHQMQDFSDPGYEYLGKLLASRGYVVASIDENFLNASWIGDYNHTEVFTRAWLILKHLEEWRTWSNTEGNYFYNKVDMDNIGLIGHSRGGPAVALASVINKHTRYHNNANIKFDFNFSIKGITQIGPTDSYNPQIEVPLKLENIDYLLLHGGYDQDIYWFVGNRFYNRLSYTDNNYHFKSALYIYRANHGQFNSVWGKIDTTTPKSWFLNLKPIMEEKDQQKVAQIYISAFMEASLKKKKEFIAIFKDYRNTNKILPKEFYINQFEDSDFRYIANYEEDFNVTTATLSGTKIQGENFKVWKENTLPFRDDWNSSQQNSGVFLGWDKADATLKGISKYTILINDSIGNISQNQSLKSLFFFICNNQGDTDNVDFTIELVTNTTTIKKTFSSLMILPPPLKLQLTKSNSIFTLGKNNSFERILQYVEIPFSELKKENDYFNPNEIKQIRFIFDRTDCGEIILDKIGVN